MQNPIRHGVLALLLGAAVTLAQPALAQKSSPNQRNNPVQATDEPALVVSVNFPGGSVEQYIVSLQKAAGDKPVNVVVPAEAKKVTLPPITLRNVTVLTALSAIQAAFETASEHAFMVSTIGLPSDGAYAIEYSHVDPATRPTAGGRPKPAKRLEVYTIRDLIEPPAGSDGGAVAKVSYENILAAVDSAMQLLDAEDAPKLLFHKETGLLMVAGTQYQTDVVDNVIKRVREDLQRRWSEDRNSKKQGAEQARRAAVARAELQLAEQELAAASTRLDRTRERFTAGASSRDEMDEAELNVARTRTMLDRKRAEVEQVVEAADEGAKTVVVYDIADLAARDSGVVAMVESVAEGLGAKARHTDSPAASAGKVVVTGTEAQHKQIKSLLESLRRLAGSKGK